MNTLPVITNLHTAYALKRIPLLLNEIDGHLQTVDMDSIRAMLEKRIESPTAQALLNGLSCPPKPSRLSGEAPTDKELNE